MSDQSSMVAGRFCPHCGARIPETPEPSSQLWITQKAGALEGGELTGVAIDALYGNLEVIINQALSAAEEADRQEAYEQKRLAAAIVAYSKTLQEQVRCVPADSETYKSLSSYLLQDAPLFFGRTQAVRAMMYRILGRGALSRLTLLHSVSGAGKTSLIQAGLFPCLLVKGHLPLCVRTGRINPVLALKQQLLQNLERMPGLARAPLRDFLYQAARVVGKNTILFIFFDQFEIFFTQWLGEEARAQFIHELGECIDDDALPARFILVLRNEYFGFISKFGPRIPHPFENEYLLLPLTRAEACEAITKPAEKQGICYEEGLAETLLDELGREEIIPSQLQLVCTALYHARKGAAITRDIYQELGGVAGILKDYLQRVVRERLEDETHRKLGRSVLKALVTLDGMRDQKTRAELAAAPAIHGCDEKTLDTVLDQLVGSRLVQMVRTGERGDRDAYELVHDYLVSEVQAWIDPREMQVKQAMEDLASAWAGWLIHSRLIGVDRLHSLASFSDDLPTRPEQALLLVHSAVARNEPVLPWLKHLRTRDAQDLIRQLEEAPSISDLEVSDPPKKHARQFLGLGKESPTGTSMQGKGYGPVAWSAANSTESHARRTAALALVTGYSPQDAVRRLDSAVEDGLGGWQGWWRRIGLRGFLADVDPEIGHLNAELPLLDQVGAWLGRFYRRAVHPHNLRLAGGGAIGACLGGVGMSLLRITTVFLILEDLSSLIAYTLVVLFPMTILGAVLAFSTGPVLLDRLQAGNREHRIFFGLAVGAGTLSFLVINLLFQLVSQQSLRDIPLSSIAPFIAGLGLSCALCIQRPGPPFLTDNLLRRVGIGPMVLADRLLYAGIGSLAFVMARSVAFLLECGGDVITVPYVSSQVQGWQVLLDASLVGFVLTISISAGMLRAAERYNS